MKARESRQLSLPLLGSRSYLQGTTLMDALLLFASEDGRLDLRDIEFHAHRIIHTDRIALETSQEDARPEDADAFMLAKRPDGLLAIAVRAAPPSPTLPRIPFDESLIFGPARFEAGRVCVNRIPQFSVATTSVSLHKALLTREVSHPRPGRWLFTRAEFAYAPASWERICVIREAALAKHTFIRSGVHLDGTRLGAIYFNWMPD
jgi:hypothetical protein